MRDRGRPCLIPSSQTGYIHALHRQLEFSRLFAHQLFQVGLDRFKFIMNWSKRHGDCAKFLAELRDFGSHRLETFHEFSNVFHLLEPDQTPAPEVSRSGSGDRPLARACSRT